MKPCIDCGVTKDITEFYAHPQMKDGTLNKCKICVRSATKRRVKERSVNPQFVIDEAARHREKSRRYREAGRANKPLNRAAVLKKSAEKYPEKERAKRDVAQAVASGRLKRMPCCKCGNIRSQAHHEDYSKPLDVVWYCSRHHAERHVQINDSRRIAKALAQVAVF